MVKTTQKNMTQYFLLKIENTKLRQERREFMQTYHCLDMRSESDYEPPITCIDIFRGSARNWEVKFCEPCNRRYLFYVKLKDNAHKRSTLARQIIKTL